MSNINEYGKLLYVLLKVNTVGLYGEIKDRPSRARVKRKPNLQF